ncbi:MAG: sulfurtransferase TusA family protein [Lachnospiraceae bacterium]|nr:sulfurtransferase TusA family protein [Lachnospiraceae bacterium]
MIDARGRSCPEPVIMLKKALESNENNYEIMVDNHVSVENVTRFAEHSGYEVHIEEKGDDFLLTLTR